MLPLKRVNRYLGADTCGRLTAIYVIALDAIVTNMVVGEDVVLTPNERRKAFVVSLRA